jgi:hypothetical protein
MLCQHNTIDQRQTHTRHNNNKSTRAKIKVGKTQILCLLWLPNFYLVSCALVSDLVQCVVYVNIFALFVVFSIAILCTSISLLCCVLYSYSMQLPPASVLIDASVPMHRITIIPPSFWALKLRERKTITNASAALEPPRPKCEAKWGWRGSLLRALKAKWGWKK